MFGKKKLKAQTEIGDRIAASDNSVAESSLVEANSLSSLLKGDNIKVSNSLLTLHRKNYILQEIVNKLTNDLSNLSFYQEKGNNQLLEQLNRREFRMMIKEAWYNYLFKGYFILGKNVKYGYTDIELEVITLENSIFNGRYSGGRLTGIRINSMSIDTDTNGMSDELMIYGNRDFAANKILYNSPLETIKEQIRTIEYGINYLQTIFARGAISPIVLTLRQSEVAPRGQKLDDMNSVLKKMFGQKDSPVNVVPLSGFDLHNVSADPKSLPIIDSIKKAEESALLGMGIPSEVMGLNEKQMAMASKKDSILVYYQSTIIPMAEQFAGALSMWLNKHSNLNDVNLAIDSTKLPFTKEKEMEALEKAATLTNVLTINEIRKLGNYEEIKGGDTLLNNNSNSEEEKSNG